MLCFIVFPHAGNLVSISIIDKNVIFTQKVEFNITLKNMISFINPFITGTDVPPVLGPNV